MTEVGGCLLTRECASCGSPVSAATAFTVALKISFDQRAGRRSGNVSAFRPEPRTSSPISSTRSNGVSSYGPIHVAVSRMYSTSVSECFVPDMNVTAETSGQSPRGANDLLGAEPVERRHDRRLREAPLERGCGILEALGLRRDDPQVERRQLVGIARREDGRVAVATAGHAEPVAVERVGVVLPPRQHRDLGNLGEMTREEAADHPCTDHADTLAHEPACASSAELAERTRGMTAAANSSWFLIAIQCGAPPAFTVMPISEIPGQIFLRLLDPRDDVVGRADPDVVVLHELLE